MDTIFKWIPIRCTICGEMIIDIGDSYRFSNMHSSCFHKAVDERKMDIMDFWKGSPLL